MQYKAIKRKDGSIYMCPCLLESVVENQPTLEQQIILELHERCESLAQEIQIHDMHNRQIKEGDYVRVLYTDWMDKERDSQYGVVKWYPREARFLIEFTTKDMYGDYRTGTLNIGPHGELEIIDQ